MSNKPNDGGPAFPIGSGDMRDPMGMTLRDWFAGMALQGILASDVKQAIDCNIAAAWSVDHANALIAALRGKEGA